jgi:tripartite-type tricarboxylate transporter receptor subunit TctC
MSIVAGSAARPAPQFRVRADAYPSRPITPINPFPPGGAADVVGRPSPCAEPIISSRW